MKIEIKNVVNHGTDQRGFNQDQAAKYIGMSTSFLSSNRLNKVLLCGGNQGPAFLRIGRKVVYLREDLDQWLEVYKGIKRFK